MKRILALLVLILFAACAAYPQTVAPMPLPKIQFFTTTGVPNASGCVYSFTTGTSTPLATYTDSTGSVQNSNPVQLDANGYGSIWLGNSTYRIQLWTFGGGGTLGTTCGGGTQIYQVDGVMSPGLLAINGLAVILSPAGRVNQTVAGPITADQFTGPATGATQNFTLNTPANSPTQHTVQPGASGHTYNVPDPGTGGNYVLNPSGNSGTSNVLDCTLAGITCKRTASYYFAGGQCNNATAGPGFDYFGTNAPIAQCVTGSNVQKGVLSLPSAYTPLQTNTGSNSATTTVTTTYPAAITAGDLLTISVGFNSTTTITGCTDGTNAYTQAKHVANGALSLDIWVFHNASTKAAGTTLTCTFSVAATSALIWHEYMVPGTTSTDVTASATGTSTTPGTGTTASTAQATELLLAADADLAAPTNVVTTSGYTDHGVKNSGTTVQVDEAGIIQQGIAGQSAAFVLGSSQAWAGAIVAIKVTNAATVTAQRTVVLPAFFNSAQAINAAIKWVVPNAPVGTSNVQLGAAIVCDADGNTDDPAYNAATTATAGVSTTAANLLINTPLNSLAAGSCGVGQTMHVQIQRLRYNVNDTYEGFVQVVGVSLSVGITQ